MEGRWLFLTRHLNTVREHKCINGNNLHGKHSPESCCCIATAAIKKSSTNFFFFFFSLTALISSVTAQAFLSVSWTHTLLCAQNAQHLRGLKCTVWSNCARLECVASSGLGIKSLEVAQSLHYLHVWDRALAFIYCEAQMLQDYLKTPTA